MLSLTIFDAVRSVPAQTRNSMTARATPATASRTAADTRALVANDTMVREEKRA